MIRALLLGWLFGCGGGPSALEGDAHDEIVLRVFLDEVGPGGGVLVVQAEYDERGQVTVPDPEAENLNFEPSGAAIAEEIGDRNVLTQRWAFQGGKGSYEIPPLTATWTHEDDKIEAKSRSVFVDIDTPPPREGELADIAEPPPVRRWPWKVILGVAGLFAAGLLLAFRPRRIEPPTITAESPDAIALRAWDLVRRDPKLTIDDKAREVARIFREYVEAVLGFEASSHTTSELVAHLGSLQHLPEGNVPRAKRVLRAADRVKFAEERPRDDIEGWLGDLDSDLRAFIESTRPSAWRSEQEP